MRQKIREVGLAGLGLGVTVRDKIRHIGRKLARKGEQSKEYEKLDRVKGKVGKGVGVAGKEALVISRKSLQMLERELRKLEHEAKKNARKAKTKVRKVLKETEPKKKRKK